jgi:hypothetical protein
VLSEVEASRQKERTKYFKEKQESEDRLLRLAPIAIGVLVPSHKPAQSPLDFALIKKK